MVVEAVDTIFGVPFKKKGVEDGSVERLEVWEADFSIDLPFLWVDRVGKDVVVEDSNTVRVRKFDPPYVLGLEVLNSPEEKVLTGPRINNANLGRRSGLIFKRSIHWRPDPKLLSET